MILIIALICLAILVIVYKVFNCDVDGCVRVGKFPLSGTPYTVCHMHHPEIFNLTESHIQREYEDAQRKKQVVDNDKR